MLDQVVLPIRFKFCPDCGENKEHVVVPNPANINFPKTICSGCTPIAFAERVGKKRVGGRHTFKRCPECREVTEFVTVGKESICVNCKPIRFKLAKEGVPLRIQRPSREKV